MKTLKLNLAAWAVVAATGMANAHLSNAGFKPEGGESLKPGDSFTVTWTQSVDHPGGTNIDFSKDGTTWTTVKAGFADADGVNSFKWTVPNEVTTNARIRICQLAGATCSDANNFSSPGNTAPYVLVSTKFAITAGTGIAANAGNGTNGSEMRFNPATRNLEVSFFMAKAGPVSIQAMDARGRVVATLLEGNRAAGSHSLSVFSNSVSQASGTLVFQLKAGGQVSTMTWNSPR
ncbi:MAG: endonuclease [Fibrobacteres bacterium]|nr:endonuclease [Fibrobacterota bacterium]